MISRQDRNTLFHLVSKLSKNEKRYLSIYLKTVNSKDKIYFRLFKVICKEAKSNEEVLQKIPEIKKAQLPNIKNFLYQKILSLLSDYQNQDDAEAKVHEAIIFIKTLYNKGLVNQCKVILNNAIHLCDEHELYLYRSLLSEWEMRLQINDIEAQSKRLDIQAENKKTDNIFLNKKSALDQYQNISDMEYLQQQVFILIRKDRFSRNLSQTNRLKKIIDNSTTLLSSKDFSSFKEGYLYHRSMGVYHITAGSYNESYFHFKQVLEQFDKYPHAKKNEVKKWKAALYNFLLNSIRCHQFDDFFHKTMAEYHLLTQRKNEFPTAFYCLQLIYHTSRAAFSEGLNLAQKIETELKTHRTHESVFLKLDLYFDLMYLFFGAGEKDKSLIWLNKILNDKSINKVEDLHGVCLLIRIIIHFEIGNENLLDYQIRSAQYFLKQKERKFQFETIFLKHMNQLLNSKDKNEQTTIFKSLQKAITPIENDTFESRVFEYFDFPLWVESQLSKFSFETLAKKVYSRQ